MTKITQLIRWAWKAWPFWIILFTIAIHLFVAKIFQYDRDVVNKYISASFQVIGGSIILISLNKDIVEIKHGNLFLIFINYLKSFPLCHRPIKLQVQSATMASTVGQPTLLSKGVWSTDEERFVEIERQIEELSRLISIKEEKIISYVDGKLGELNALISQNKSEIQDVSKKIDNTIIGIIKYEILGFLLLLYAVVLNLL